MIDAYKLFPFQNAATAMASSCGDNPYDEADNGRYVWMNYAEEMYKYAIMVQTMKDFGLL